MYLGLDLSLNATGVVLIDEDYTVVKQSVITEEAIGAERLFLNEKNLLGFIETYEKLIKLACIESSAYRADGKLFDIGQWAGVVELNLYKLGIETIFAAPSQLKKYAAGRYDSKMSKAVIIKNVYKNFGEDFDDDNLCDAYVVSRIAHDFYNLCMQSEDYEIEHYQKSVLTAINKNYKKAQKGKLL